MTTIIEPTPEAMHMLTERALDAYRRMLYPRARQCAQTILRFEPEHVGMFVMMAELEAHAEDWSASLRWWQKALGAGRTDALSVLRAAEVATLARDWSTARVILGWFEHIKSACTSKQMARADRLRLYVHDQLKHAS